ncbi:MAG: DUF349 domain-containing protein [Bacteroides sp.]|jgi:hypothetical protein|nr:DUF349 domain-containing protein [Bacteroides sp.]
MKKKEQLDPKADQPVDQQGDESLKADQTAPTDEAENAGEPEQGKEVIEPGSETTEVVEAASETEAIQPEEEAKEPEPEAEATEKTPEDVVASTEATPEDPTADETAEPVADPNDKVTPEESGSEEETPAVSEEPPVEETKTATVPPVAPATEKAEISAEEEEEEEEEEAEHEEGEETEDLNEHYGKMDKDELVQVLEALVKHEDINFIRKHIGYIKAAFRKLTKDDHLVHYEKSISQEEVEEGAQAQETPTDPLVQRFEHAINVYKEKKAVFDQALEKHKQENLDVKEKILEELRNLIESEEELKKTYDQFRDLQEKWRDIGPVPQNAKNTLWNNYHFLVEKFFDKVKINKELKDLDLKKNLELKTELCEKAEELLLEPSIVKSFQRLQKLHEAWKETGPVPNDKKEEIWERFRAATEKLNKRRQEYYDGLREEQQKNLAAKLVLCEKAEQLASQSPETPRQWQDLTNQINELFKMWKTIGFAPKKVNNEVWTRFRNALDSFFNNKKEFFQKFKENQTENYNQKLNLCLQAEALKESNDWRRTTDELIALQHEWKKIGTVPNKFSDKIWKRFRAACDEFFKKKSEYFANIGEMQEENLQKKKDIIEQIHTYAYSDDNSENLKVINDFQRQWMEIGHVPIKQKDKIQGEYRKAIDEQFEKLGISKKAKSTLSFRSKIENIKHTPNADHIIYKERNFLLNKISTIQNDIKVWENNIGFFASSTKADILKNEFEEKIEKAKQEITILEEKLKILRES